MDIGNISSSNVYNQDISNQGTQNSQNAESSKLSYIQALSANSKNISSCLISSISSINQSSTSGLHSDFIYHIYDSKAITPQILDAYFKKIADSEQNQDSTESNPSPITSTISTSETNPENSLPTPSSNLPSFSQGKGYDMSAVQKYYQDIQKFYNDPNNKYKTYISNFLQDSQSSDKLDLTG